MTWDPRTSNGFESDKCRFDVLPYLARGGLDIGCGARKVWPHLVGVDSGKDIELFGTQMAPDVVVPDASRMPMFADGAIDAVFSSHVLEHIDNWKMALAEWWRLVRVGGHLVVYLPHKDFYPNIGTPGANPDHKHDFLPADIVGGMEALGADWSLLVNESRGERNEYSFLQVYRKEAAGHGHAFPCDTPRPAKRAAIVRIGAKGDALWASSPARLLKAQGYEVTLYVASTGEEVLRHDPNIDRLVQLPNGALSDGELHAYWMHEAGKYDKWINLVGSVEQRLLYHQSSNEFFLPHPLRHRFGNVNYLEMVHDYAGVPHDFHQQFYATAEEQAMVRQFRGMLPEGPLVVVNACGSGPAKTWPHLQAFLQRMADAHIATVVLGDLRDLRLEEVEPYVAIVGNEWPVRIALAFAQTADAVVGTESMILNSVASLDVLKVALLSHSSNENLTKHWRNTVALEASVPCHPCHRIHADMTFCAKDTATGRAACMASYSPDQVADIVISNVLGAAPAVQSEALQPEAA
jgi:ADP-heptose:LPS heptosyltransferase/predicted SAM-dependent methyltransferase